MQTWIFLIPVYAFDYVVFRQDIYPPEFSAVYSAADSPLSMP
jgi:hypothetical protein